MKYLSPLIIFLGVVILIASCKKYKVEPFSITSLTAVNAVVGGTSMKVGSQSATIENNSFAHISLFAGNNDLYVWPVADSLHPYFSSRKFVTINGEGYTLFVCGEVGNTEGIIVKDNLPFRRDSTAGIRFINLSPDSSPLNITLSTSPSINEVSNLAYKQYTEFKTYPGFYNSEYTFEIRDAFSASPGIPLATYSMSTFDVPRFSNVTLVIGGLVGASPALDVTRVNNDR